VSDGFDDDQAPGWDAITAAMRGLHGDQEPKHWGVVTKLPGEPGLDGISAYDAGDHWHFVTLGLTELWFKESDDAEISGFGYEFTMRVSHGPGEDPPAWALKILQRLADATFDGREFRPGHTLDPGNAITGNASSALRALLFVLDPGLGPISTPHGRVEFVQVVGISTDELEAIMADRSAVASLQADNPLLITDPGR
jgi:suppressor of fused